MQLNRKRVYPFEFYITVYTQNFREKTFHSLSHVFSTRVYPCLEAFILRSWQSAGFNEMGSPLASMTSDEGVKWTEVNLKSEKLKSWNRCHKDNRPWTHQENINLFCHNHLFDDVGWFHRSGIQLIHVMKMILYFA